MQEGWVGKICAVFGMSRQWGLATKTAQFFGGRGSATRRLAEKMNNFWRTRPRAW